MIRQQSGIEAIEARGIQLAIASSLHSGFSSININILHRVLLFVQPIVTVTEATIIHVVASLIELNKASICLHV